MYQESTSNFYLTFFQIPEGTEKRIDLLQLMMDAESPDEMIDDSALTMTQDDADEGTKSKNGTAPEKRPTKAGVRVAKKISSQVSLLILRVALTR